MKVGSRICRPQEPANAFSYYLITDANFPLANRYSPPALNHCWFACAVRRLPQEILHQVPCHIPSIIFQKMAKLFVLLACVGLFQAAYGLQCYTCSGDNCDSKSNMEHWQKPTCGKSNDPKLEPACMKHTYKDKSGKEMVERGCHLVPTSGDFTCPRIGDTTTVSCNTCKADLCNSAQSVKFNIFAIAGVLCSFLMTKLFM